MRTFILKIINQRAKVKRIMHRIRLFLQPASLYKKIHMGKNLVLHVPVRADGEGRVVIGNNAMMGFPLASKYGDGEIMIQARMKDAVIEIGDNASFSNNVSLVATCGISIGRDSLIGEQSTIIDSDFHEIDPVRRKTGPGASQPVTIGNNVWIGSRVFVQKGVTIGDNSVITPHSVVTRSIPENCIAGGVPAKIIRRIS